MIESCRNPILSHTFCRTSYGLINVQNIDTYYGKIRALTGVSLIVKPGEIVCLIGSNGAGKTTMLKTICGLLRPANGTIMFDDEDLTRIPPHEIVKRGIALVPEGRQVFSRMTTQENLAIGAFIRQNKQSVDEILKGCSLFFRGS